MNPFLNKQFDIYYQQSPLTLLDVGARYGVQTHWRSCNKYLRVIGFEPDSDECRRLNNCENLQNDSHYLNLALSDENGTRTFHQTHDLGLSSLLKPNNRLLNEFPEASRFEITSSTTANVTTLDQALETSKIADPDFLKADTQGTELFILKGGRQAIKDSIFGIEVEVEFSELYENQPLFSEVDRFLTGIGFSLFDLRTIHWKRKIGNQIGGRKGQIMHGDALYFKNSGDFFNNGPCTAAKLMKAITICIVYGYYDYALFLCNKSADFNILNPKEFETVVKHLSKPRHISALWPKFPGRDRVANILWLAHDIFRSYYWAHSGSGSTAKNIGNIGDMIIGK